MGSQHIGGLFPCEMCYWQRWPHEAALAFAIMALLARDAGIRRLFVYMAAFAIMTSGLIGIFHAGVEYKWWEGLTQCTAPPTGSIADLMTRPLIRCDEPQWTLGPISLAGFNAIFSIGGALLVIWTLTRRKA